LIFLHGFSDHIDRYKDLLFPHLAAAGITVHAFDQRGWGKTVKTKAERGLTGPTSQVMADIECFVRARLDPNLPNFLMGHSMGGQETAYFLATAPKDVREKLTGYILSSPFIVFGSKLRPPKLQVIAGRFAGKILPKFQMLNPMDPAWMSHDDALNKDWKEDPLCHDTGTLEGLSGMIDRAESLDEHRVTVEDWDGLRVLLLHGDADVCCDAPGAQKWMEHAKLKNKEVKIFDGAYHCGKYSKACG
jgi:acylglycerol lipase